MGRRGCPHWRGARLRTGAEREHEEEASDDKQRVSPAFARVGAVSGKASALRVARDTGGVNDDVADSRFVDADEGGSGSEEVCVESADGVVTAVLAGWCSVEVLSLSLSSTGGGVSGDVGTGGTSRRGVRAGVGHGAGRGGAAGTGKTTRQMGRRRLTSQPDGTWAALEARGAA